MLTKVPPHEPEYHVHVAPGDNVPVNVRVDEPAEQSEVGFAFAAVAAAGVVFTVTVIFLQPEKHPAFSART